jgi:hypothetical protein
MQVLPALYESLLLRRNGVRCSDETGIICETERSGGSILLLRHLFIHARHENSYTSLTGTSPAAGRRQSLPNSSYHGAVCRSQLKPVTVRCMGCVCRQRRTTIVASTGGRVKAEYKTAAVLNFLSHVSRITCRIWIATHEATGDALWMTLSIGQRQDQCITTRALLKHAQTEGHHGSYTPIERNGTIWKDRWTTQMITACTTGTLAVPMMTRDGKEMTSKGLCWPYESA